VNFTEHEIVLDETPTGVCSVKEETRGIGHWNSPVSDSSDYAVTVTVNEGSSLQSFTQIAAINGGPAKLQIKYTIQTISYQISSIDVMIACEHSYFVSGTFSENKGEFDWLNLFL
jgi:hypothetical protein